jgi:hypothetical protein
MSTQIYDVPVGAKSPKVDARLVLCLLDYRRHLLTDYQKMGGDPLWDVQFKAGSKYIRVFTISHGSRSCHSFVDYKGVIWKSASWKAPAKNFPRGDVNDPTSWGNIHWNGL